MLIFSGALKKVVRQMEKDRIFNDDDINAIADLMEIMDNADPESNIYKVQRVLNRELFVKFREAGVEVPYRQIDLHQK